mmetsp:Transcript_85459/g.242294  ORF Transcript_85459/g.242294 Transcript_85459/m.242294 type:complete len:375 (-) Transcript_85459:56-1180(-)
MGRCAAWLLVSAIPAAGIFVRAPAPSIIQHGMPFCSDEAGYINGTWVRDARKTAARRYWLGGGRSCRGRYGRSWQPPDFYWYRWVPQRCKLAPFHARDLCDKLDGQTIGLAGDSMTTQFAHSLIGLMHVRNWTMNGWEFARTATTQLFAPVELCPAGSGRSVRLLRLLAYHPPVKDAKLFKQLVNESDILVLNWGAHWLNDSQMEQFIKSQRNGEDLQEDSISTQMRMATDSEVERGVKGITRIIAKFTRPRVKHPRRVFWRATNVFHNNCSNVTAPYTNPFSLDDERIGYFHGHEVLRQERSIIWPAMRALGVTILRTDAFTNLRADGHVAATRNYFNAVVTDCLHYCEPGVVDTWSQLFFNYMVGHIVSAAH